ncbi:MAG TPA: L-threonylcarbamoyladenylate synthase [Candidatus Saccharimonadia bacterium]|nr:L-threonylcarbamoyladenylate synthase [Candidatus Saccharimonadia bacterium]
MKVFTSLTDSELIQLLKEGAVGVMPTDTVYGLACRAADPKAVERLYGLKQRENKPGTIIAGRLQELIDLGLRARYLKAVEHYWPNSLSVVIPCADTGLAYLHQGKNSLAVRVPAYEDLQKLTRHTGALLTSSANQPGEQPATNLAEAQAYFGDSVDFYVDGGVIKDHVPSTVIRVIDDAIEVLREGAVKIDENGRIS